MRGLLFALILAFATPAFATTYYVNKAGNNGNSCGTATSATDASAKLTITAGIACLSAGDTLMVGDGTYVEAYRGYLGQNIPSGSSGAPTIIQAEHANLAIMRPNDSANSYILEITNRSWIVIDGMAMDACLMPGSYPYRLDGTTTNVVLQNGSAYNGNNTFSSGIALHGTVGGNTVRNMRSYNNGRQTCGGAFPDPGVNMGHGLYVVEPDALIEDSEFDGNGNYGVQFYNGAASTANNGIFRRNSVNGNGQGLLLSSGTGITAYNNLVYGNLGYGIILNYAAVNPTIYYNTLYGNASICIISIDSSGGIARNNICYGNAGDVIDESGGAITDSNNLFTNPSFVCQTTSCVTSPDFHLFPTSAALPPCGTNIGSIASDKDGITRGNPPSCGAYEVPSGSDPGSNLVEDFQSYTAGTSIDGLNGGTGWTQTWQLIEGTATVENTSCLTGKAFRSTAVVDTEVRRFFTAKSGEFTIQAKLCLDTTAHNNLVGISLIDSLGGYQIAVWFSASGNALLYDNGTVLTTLATYAANTSYRVRFNFDTVNQPGKVRISINDVAYGAWINTVSSFSSISGLYFNNYSTSAHTFEMDDINSEAGPPSFPPGATTPVGIKARIRGRI